MSGKRTAGGGCPLRPSYEWGVLGNEGRVGLFWEICGREAGLLFSLPSALAMAWKGVDEVRSEEGMRFVGRMLLNMVMREETPSRETKFWSGHVRSRARTKRMSAVTKPCLN